MTRADRTTFGYAVPLAGLAAAGLALLVWISADEAVAVRVLAAATLPLWSLDVEPTYLYPVAVQVRPGGHRRIEDDLDRHEAAWSGYRVTGSAIATDFPAPTKMSSRQRLGMVEDMWEQALARLVGHNPPRRRSCCLMYALPGLDACAGCPRRP